MARRRAGLSQTGLASKVGVQRGAGSHWEGNHARKPSTSNLRRVAEVTGVHFEWLATGRGPMSVAGEVLLDSIEAAEGIFIEDALEMRLIRAFRSAPLSARLALIELSECLPGPTRSPRK